MRQKLQLIILMFWGSLLINSSTYSQEIKPTQISINQKTYNLYPETLEELPDMPSPYTTEDGIEIVIVITKDNNFALIPVTVENGEPWMNEDKRGKGQQLDVDAEDFPVLARTGLHSETDLDYTRKITGRSAAEITESGRPGGSSRAGFMAQDEDIISVLRGDNQIVKKMGLTHPQLAKPMFHIFNIIRLRDEIIRVLGSPLAIIDYMLYNGRKIHLIGWESGHGWQESIFNDEILGFFQINVEREPNPDERAYLSEKYSHLDEEQLPELFRMISTIHFGEMAAFYAMRYGFYEGHTNYRADPIAVAFIFGLRSIEEIENAFEGNLYKVLKDHFTK